MGESIQVIVFEIRNPTAIKGKKGVEMVGSEVVGVAQDPIVLGLVNPKIVKKSGTQTSTEGCLCLPGVEAPVERASQVLVKALNEEGEPIEISAAGMTATILQHEIDHLIGKVFIDRVKDPSQIVYKLPEELPITERE